MSDPVQKNLEPYIDKLHAHHSAKEWAEFNTIKANLIKQIKDDNVQVKVYEYFTEHDKNLPAPYNKPEYAWLKDIGKQLVPKSFKIVSDKETLEFEQLAKKIADRRPDYKNNRQWFSSFTKEDIEKSDVADQYKTQYDELGAGAPQSVTDLSEIHRKRQKI
jgi:wyosine [tRNA(Phe)-imidazoG37] synthetase (radical SAM superfamily)